MGENMDIDQIGPTTVCFVTGRPWKDAVISLLEPRSPYRPWTTQESVEPGHSVVVALDTDPTSVLSAVGTVGSDGEIRSAITQIKSYRREALLEMATLDMLSMEDIESVLDRYVRQGAKALFGHTSLAAARVLLASRGRCTACNTGLALSGRNARDQIHIHTAEFVDTDGRPIEVDLWDSYAQYSAIDWPAALCNLCAATMRDEGFTSFLDFQFASRPSCPECSAQRTMTPLYGMPAGPIEEPWIATMGCVVVEPRAKWVCGHCRHEWR